MLDIRTKINKKLPGWAVQFLPHDFGAQQIHTFNIDDKILTVYHKPDIENWDKIKGDITKILTVLKRDKPHTYPKTYTFCHGDW